MTVFGRFAVALCALYALSTAGLSLVPWLGLNFYFGLFLGEYLLFFFLFQGYLEQAAQRALARLTTLFLAGFVAMITLLTVEIIRS